MIDREAWSRAYAKQAKADFDTYRKLERESGVPECERLHLLQMSCEKLSKAHLCHRGSDPERLATSHAYIATTLPIIAREQYARMTGKNLKDRADLFKQIGHLAREIELLAPSVGDDTRRPDNCEYPWIDSWGRIVVPAEYEFPNLSLFIRPAGILLINRILPQAIEELASAS